jgi:hypothetical protein
MSYSTTAYLMVAVPINEVFSKDMNKEAMWEAAESLKLEVYGPSESHKCSYTHIGLTLAHVH